MPSIGIGLFLSLFAQLFFPVFFPGIPFFYFAPFLVIVFYKKEFQAALKIAFFCGLFLDLLYSNLRLGLYAANFFFTVWVLYDKKKHFFEESLTTIPLMTFLFSLVSFFFQIFLLKIFDRTNSYLSFALFQDIFFMALLDAIYGFVWFTLPHNLFAKHKIRFKKKSKRFITKVLEKKAEK